MPQLRSRIALLVFALFLGCNRSSDFDLSPAMKPVPDRTAEASEYAAWQPTPEQLSELGTIKSECKGELKPLLDHPKWSGDRLRVTGIKGGIPVTKSIGPWHIALFPAGDHIVEIRGLLFAKGHSVKLDMDRDVLIVNGVEFKGSFNTGESPMFENAPFRGVSFEKEGLGLTMGSASILFLDDGRLVMDFHKVVVEGTRAGEYGVLNAEGQD
jgi:hypothetical protein